MPEAAAPLRIGLISQTADADDDAVRTVAAALHVQLQRDVGPIWGAAATVEAFTRGTRPPAGVSPIFIVDNTPNHVGGLHTTTDGGLPWAIVLVSRDWHLAASHEAIELLIDPTGNRMQDGLALSVRDGTVQDGTTRVRYLVEACDPIEDADHAYRIDGIAVSDFYTPNYFDDAVTPGTRYSFNGALTRPREVGRNGYLSWRDNATGRYHQLRNFDGYAIVDLPDASEVLNARMFVDHHTPTPRTHPELFNRGA